jgi:hypothetical protein
MFRITLNALQRALELKPDFHAAQKLLSHFSMTKGTVRMSRQYDAGPRTAPERTPDSSSFKRSLIQALEYLPLPSPLRLHMQEQPLLVQWQWQKLSWSEEPNLARVPFFIYKIGSYILRNCRDDEGIFRLSPNRNSLTRSLQLLKLGEIDHVDLSEPHLAPVLFLRYLESAGFQLSLELLAQWPGVGSNQSAQEDFLKQLVAHLSTYHRRLLQYYLFVFRQVSSRAPVNKMTASNIALVASPNLLPADILQKNPNFLRSLVQILTCLIERDRHDLFPEPISRIIASPDERWENYEPEVREKLTSDDVNRVRFVLVNISFA